MLELHDMDGNAVYLSEKVIAVISRRRDSHGRYSDGSIITTTINDVVLVVREDPKTVLAAWRDAD